MFGCREHMRGGSNEDDASKQDKRNKPQTQKIPQTAKRTKRTNSKQVKQLTGNREKNQYPRLP
jgi:hypothetical protein